MATTKTIGFFPIVTLSKDANNKAGIAFKESIRRIKSSSTIFDDSANTPIKKPTITERIETEIEIKNDSIHIENQSNTDEARLAELSEELKKIPVSKVKQWHNEGKITDEQYKTVARKYNEIRKEMKEIKERAELAKSIEIEE